ncbi:MAG: hypothetical protein U1F06_10570 [Steroidobacteraceae bacterium]
MAACALLARELSKAFEMLYRGTLDELVALAGREPNLARGEITMVIEGAPVAEEEISRCCTRRSHCCCRSAPPPARAPPRSRASWPA